MSSLLLSHFWTLSFLFILFFLPPPSLAATSASANTCCDATPHPSYCKSLLHDKQGTINDYCRFFVTHSMSTASTFLSLVNRHLKSQSQYSKTTIYALQDCCFLSNLDIDYLSTTMAGINTTDTLPTSQVDQLLAFLSAVITDLQTCSDGLQTFASSNVANDLSPHVSNGTMSYSVSLALFTHGWASGNTTRGRKLEGIGDGFLSREMRVSKWPLENLGHVSFGEQSPGLRSSRRGRRLFQVDGLNITVNDMVTVNPDGTGNFTTINDAVSAAPNNTMANNGYFLIYVVAGVYQEYVSIPPSKTYLLMVGDGINQTIITGNRSVVDGWTTFDSSTFAVVAEGFVAVKITFRNTAGAIKQQAVALRNGADLSAFYLCSFEAYQDTLYTHSLRQFYRQCDIYGTVDFIFGNAAVVFQDCNIYARQPLQGQFNAITAQGRTDPNQNTGTSIHSCSVTAAADLASSNYTVETYLGRPWKEYSRTVYMQSFMDSLINPAGWHEWSGTFALDTLYYGEYNNTGPRSNTTNRVTWSGYHIMNETDAENFTVTNFIVGDYWLPQTRIPYTGVKSSEASRRRPNTAEIIRLCVVSHDCLFIDIHHIRRYEVVSSSYYRDRRCRRNRQRDRDSLKTRDGKVSKTKSRRRHRHSSDSYSSSSTYSSNDYSSSSESEHEIHGHSRRHKHEDKYKKTKIKDKEKAHCHKRHKHKKEKDQDDRRSSSPVQLSKFLGCDKEDGVRHSAVSGKKIQMKLEKSNEDRLVESKCNELLKFLNASCVKQVLDMLRSTYEK